MSPQDLSQARIKPGYVLQPEDIVEPKMSTRDWEDFEKGVSLFNEGAYWDSHEAWELVWKRHNEPSRVFFGALIQFAAAYHQLHRGILHGVIKHFRNAATKLAPFPEAFLGVDVAAIKAGLDAGITEVGRLGEDGLRAFPKELIIPIGFRLPKG